MAYAITLNSTTEHGEKTRKGKKTMDAESLKAHIDRKGNYANQENVDQSRTGENYSLDDWDDNLGYYERAQQLRKIAGINKNRNFKKGKSFCASFVVTASQEDMDTLTADEQRAYFTTAKEWLDDYFGSDMLLYADVHMDETTPHMHIGYVPINEDTRSLRWDSKIQKTSMSQHFQQELPKALKDAGFDFEMPKDQELTEAKHVTPKAYRKIAKAYKDAIKDELTDELETDYVPKYKAKREKDVDKAIGRKQAKQLDNIKANDKRLETLNADLLRLARAKTKAEAEKKLAEEKKKLADEEAKEAKKNAERASQELSEALADVVDINELKKSKYTVQDILEDAGVDWKIAEELSNGKVLKSKAGKPLNASKLMRKKAIGMTFEEKKEFRTRQTQQIKKQDDELER